MGINEDKSLPYRFFLFIPVIGKIKEGDIIAFEPLKDDIFMKGLKGLIVKEVGCAYPSRLIVKGKEYYCVKYLGKALERNSDGRKVKHFVYSGQVPKNCYFVIGKHEMSYDSRYFGFVCRDKVKYKVLFTR